VKYILELWVIYVQYQHIISERNQNFIAENISKNDYNVIETLSLNTLMGWRHPKHERRDNKSLHHIIGKSRGDKFNVSEPENKIIITQKTHDALNNLFWTAQSPKEQMLVMMDIRDTALSKETKRALIDLLTQSDRTFYLRKLVK